MPMNGNDTPPAAAAQPVPTSEQVGQTNALLATISPAVKAVVGTMIRGLMVSFPGVPPHVVLTMLSFETANFIGQALQGDIAMIAGIRKGYKEAFEEGLRKAPIVPPSKSGDMPTNLRG